MDGWYLSWGPKYDEQCQIEIEKLRNLALLEQQLGTAKGPFKLSKKRGAKTNLLRLLSALYEMHLIELTNGQRPTKEQFIHQIGGFLGVDAKNYSSDLEQALNQSLEANLEVFNDLQENMKKQVLAKQK